jgi:hypothetical protein
LNLEHHQHQHQLQLQRYAIIRDKFEIDGTVQNVNKDRSGRPGSSTHDESVATVLLAYIQSPTHTSIPPTLQDLRREIEIACAAVPLPIIQNVCQSVALCCQHALLLMVDILNICDIECESS